MEIKTQIRPGRSIHLAIHENPDSHSVAFLIHGLGGRGDQWREQMECLKKYYTLVIPDLLGHGGSEKPRPNKSNPYSFDELDQDLQMVFNRYSREKNIVIGHSYGGALATSLALDHQDKISKFILLSPTPCQPNLSMPLLYRLPASLMGWFRPLMERQFERLAFTENANPQLIATEYKANQNNPMYVIKWIVNGMQKIPEIDLSMLNIPALIIIGEQDKLVPPSAQREFYQRLPDHEFSSIQDGSHMALLEEPLVVNQAIRKFLRIE